MTNEQGLIDALSEIDRLSGQLRSLTTQKAAIDLEIAATREAIKELMASHGMDKFSTGAGQFQLAKAPSQTQVALSDAEFARRWPHLTKPAIAAAKKAAKDDPILAEILIPEEGEGLVLKFKPNQEGGDEVSD